MTGLYVLQVGSVVSYLVAVLVPALDVVIPVLPSETVVIALGVGTAGSADPRIGLPVALAAFGAFLGDNAAYLLGKRFGPMVDRRLFAGPRGAARRAWAERSLDRFGARIIIGCRFVPGGRTAVTVTCGLVGFPRRRFTGATACAGVVWASYAFFLGRLGGKAFEHQAWIGLLLALGWRRRSACSSRQPGARSAGTQAGATAPRRPADPQPLSATGRPSAIPYKSLGGIHQAGPPARSWVG